VKTAYELYEHWIVIIGMARDTLILAQEKQAKYYDKGYRDLEIQKRDQ
ncbi:1343_t:CDS:1, partial [Racocetra persica]